MIQGFWDVTSGRWVSAYRHFEGMYCLHSEGSGRPNKTQDSHRCNEVTSCAIRRVSELQKNYFHHFLQRISHARRALT